MTFASIKDIYSVKKVYGGNISILELQTSSLTNLVISGKMMISRTYPRNGIHNQNTFRSQPGDQMVYNIHTYIHTHSTYIVQQKQHTVPKIP